MQRPLGIWTNIAIVKLLMPLIVPRFGGPVKVKMVNIRTHFFYQLFKFAIFWENSRTLYLCIVLPSTGLFIKVIVL